MYKFNNRSKINGAKSVLSATTKCMTYHTNASLIACLLNVNHPASWSEEFIKQAMEMLMKEQILL